MVTRLGVQDVPPMPEIRAKAPQPHCWWLPDFKRSMQPICKGSPQQTAPRKREIKEQRKRISFFEGLAPLSGSGEVDEQSILRVLEQMRKSLN